MITITYYQESDFSGFYELMQHWGDGFSITEEAFKQSIAHVLSNKNNKLLIAKQEHIIVGYAQIDKCCHLGFEPFLEVSQLLVAEGIRSSGIGKLLMAEVELEARKENLQVIKLSSQVQRSGAHVFYEKLGYHFYKISKFYQKQLT